MSEGSSPAGSSVYLYCTNCGAPTPIDALFCSKCGANLNPSAEVTPAVATVPAEVEVAAAGTVFSGQVPVAAAYTPAVEYGGFWLRVVAAILDSMLVQVVVMPVAFVIGAAIGAAGTAVQMPDEGVGIVGLVAGMTLGLLAGWIYEAWMESSEKQATLGKMLLGLKVTDLQGGRLSFGRATGRHFAKYISSMTLGIGYIMAGFTEKKQALHDMIVGTLVVRKQ